MQCFEDQVIQESSRALAATAYWSEPNGFVPRIALESCQRTLTKA